jgi:hypothetical protein
MSENTLDTAELSQGTEHETKTRTLSDICWTWMQPTFALGAPLLVAVTLLSDWWQEADRMLFDLVMIFLPIPVFIRAEKRWSRGDWKLKPSELADDSARTVWRSHLHTHLHRVSLLLVASCTT